MNLELALVLRRRRGEWVTLDALGREAGIGGQDLRGALGRLQAAGFRLEAHPGGMLRAVAAPQALDADQITHRLGTRIVGRRIVVVEETSSTNDLAWKDLAAGGAEGTCWFAEHQTRGRGRQGRPWFAPRGTAILMSVGLRPRRTACGGAALTFAAAVAAAEAVRASTGLPAAIEWPNDITCRDRKVGGILVEARRLRPNGAPPGPPEPACVVGIGINANVPPAALPPEVRKEATSLAEECGRPVDRVLLARRLVRALDRWYGRLAGGGVEEVQRRWGELSATVGRRLAIMEDGRRFEGVVVHESPLDGLALRLDTGHIRMFRANSASVVERRGRG